MKIKNTLILLLIFVVLLAFYYIYEIEGGKKRKAAEELAARLVKFNQEEVIEVKLESKDRPTLIYRRDGDKWVIFRPVETPGDQNDIDRNLSSFTGAKIERTITTTLTDLSKYGLDYPRATVTFTLKDSSRKTLLIGDENPTGNFVFVKFKDKPDIYTTEKNIYTAATKKLYDLRDKKIAHFERDQVRKMVLQRPGEKLVFEKENDKWRILKPIEIPLKQWEVNGIISSLENNKAKRFEDEDPEDLSLYGLDKPQYEVHLYLGEQLSEVVFSVGDSSDYKDQFFAREASRKPVFTVDLSLVKKLRKRLFDFQDRKLFQFSNADVKKIEYRDEQEQFMVELLDTTWSLTGNDTIPASEKNVTSWLNKIRNLMVDDIETYYPGKEDKYGFTKPTLEISIYGQDGLLGKMTIGYKIGDNYLVRNDKYNYVYRIKESKVKNILKKADDLKQANEETPDFKTPEKKEK